MPYRFTLLLWILCSINTFAAFTWRIDTVLSRFAEDSLVLFVSSESPLPMLGLRLDGSCPTALKHAAQIVPGTEWRPAKNQKEGFWILPGKVFPAGPLCLQPMDVSRNLPMGTASAMVRHSRERHKLVESQSHYPWTFQWSRPSSVAWTRAQIGTRDLVTGKERILTDIFTRTQQAKIPFAHGNLYWIRFANAYDSSATNIDTNSWVVFPLPTLVDSLLPPILLFPQDHAEFTRSQMEQGLEFRWSTTNAPMESQISLFKSEPKGWTQISRFPTSQESFTIPFSTYPAGKYQWMVYCVDSLGRVGQSVPREFQLNGNLQTYTAQIFLDGKPLNGADVSVITGKQSQTLRTSFQSSMAGVIRFSSEPGFSSFELHRHGNSNLATDMELAPVGGSIALHFYSLAKGTLTGFVCDLHGLPLSGVSIELLQGYGERISVTTSYTGTFQADLAFGTWQWKIPSVDSGVVHIQRNQLYQLDTIQILQNQVIIQGYTQPGTTIQFFGKKGSHFTIIANDKGFYQLSLLADIYQMHAECHGFYPLVREISIQSSLNYPIPLMKGASVLSGMVNSLEEIELGSPIQSAVEGAEILAWQMNSSDTLHAFSGALGEYRISLPSSGAWKLCAKKQSKRSSTISVTVPEELELRVQDLVLQYQARINGSITGLPTSAASPYVLLVANGEFITKQLAHVNTANQWEYEFRDVSQGTYSILVRSTGFIPLDTPNVLITTQGRQEVRGTWEIPPIGLQASTSQLALHSRFHVFGVKSINAAFVKTDPVAAQLHLEMPHDTSVSTPSSLSLGNGTYLYSLIPNDRRWIPLWQQKDTLLQFLNVDTILWPAYHVKPATITPSTNDTIKLKLETYELQTLTHLHVLDGDAYKTLSPSISFPDSAVFKFTINHPAPTLSYWFEIHSSEDNRIYSNPAPFLHYEVPVAWKSIPFEILTNTQDSLFLFSEGSTTIQIQAYSQYGNLDLTKQLQAVGTLSWEISPSRGLQIRKGSDKELSLSVLPEEMGTYKLVLRGKIADEVSTKTIWIQVRQSVAGRFSIQALRSEESSQSTPDAILLQATVTDSAMKSWHIPVTWSLSPANAGSIDEGNTLIVHSSFIGNIQVTATYEKQSAVLQIPIIRWIQPNQRATVFQFDSNVQVRTPDSLATAFPVAIGLTRFEGLGKPIWHRRGKDSVSGFFNLEYPASYPYGTPTLAFRISALNPSQAQPYTLDTSSTQIQPMDSVRMDDSTDAPTWSWIQILPKQAIPTYYGLLQEPSHQKSTSLKLVPNPFSPFIVARVDGNSELGTAIHFNLYYPGLQQVYVSLEILSLSGDPIKTLLKNQIQTTAEHTLYWDGTTESGHMVRNGRYLVILSLRKQANGKIIQQLAKPVVVFQ